MIIIIDIIATLIIVGIIVYATIIHNEGTISDDLDYPPGVKKTIIYLYPKETTELSVKLGKTENITCSYPEYGNGWNVIANTDGTLIDINTGRKLYSLYWEEIQSEPINFEEGFVVKGSDTIQFLEEKLAILGLNEIEAEEFIVYWLPKLQENEYNYIRFATMDKINKNMPLEFSVEPDTIIRVLMQFKALHLLSSILKLTVSSESGPSEDAVTLAVYPFSTFFIGFTLYVTPVAPTLA